MRAFTWSNVLVVALFLSAAPGARAQPAARSASPAQSIDGAVVASQARWDAAGRRIVTESVVRASDGTEITVIQSGGAVDGVRMVQIPAPPVLRAGDRVTLRAVAGAAHLPWRVTEVTRLERPEAPAPPAKGPMTAVQTTNATGAGLFWSSGCIFITPDAAGTSHLPGETEIDVIRDVMNTWNTVVAQCSYLNLQLDAAKGMEVGFDRVNTIKFRDDLWCRPATEDEPEECYAPQAAGITTLFFIEDETSERDGEVLDGDIELNAVDFTISLDGETEGPPNRCLSDLKNTLTHEIGHLMGLDHTCFDGVGDRPVDTDGNPVPTCTLTGGLPPDVTEATMFNFQDCGETKKGSPEQNDVGGICAIYAVAEDPGSCERVASPTAGCCAVAPGGHSPAAPLASLWPLLALCAVVAVRRLRRRQAGIAPSRSSEWP